MDINEEKIYILHRDDDDDASTPTQVPDAFRRSEGELTSIKARQKKVWEALQKLTVNIQKDEEPPVIAILGSGGGLRAMVGCLGVLAELAKEDVLDIITYICGTSGSTWCMSSLYNNEKWSSCMEEMEHQIADRLLKSEFKWSKALEKLKETFTEEMYSLTYLWAYAYVYHVLNEINEKTLSNHQTSCESGENPYPVYSAVEKDSLNSKEPGTWFEFTPHMAGFPAYKTFVRTELLGSEFREGKLVTNHPERELCYLQGLWGSALASETVIKETILEKIRNFFQEIKRHVLFSGKTSRPSINEDMDVVRFSGKTYPPINEAMDVEVLCDCNGCQDLRVFFSSHDLVGMTDTELEMLLIEFHNMEDSIQPANKTKGFHPVLNETFHCRLLSDFRKLWDVYASTKKCFLHWQWGTTNNFLYEWSGKIPDDLYKKKFLSLVDAGLEINSAYPLMLQPNRKVDLILSFDFSEGDPFLTLKNTDEYCKKNGIPFPKINIENAESEAPSQSCYVFEGDGKGVPDVMHFPLFNNQSCEGKIDELRKKYPTRHNAYGKSELTELLKISKINVAQNKDRILQKVQQLIQCKSSV